MPHPAVFLDRDGTLIEDPGYLDNPEGVILLPDVGQSLRRLKEVGFQLILCTNQSGVARGYFTEDVIQKVHDRLMSLLREFDVVFDGVYYCPHHPEGIVEAYRTNCTCRKPSPGLFEQAISEMNIAPNRSWSIGDKPRDIEAGEAVGVRGILVDGDVTFASAVSRIIQEGVEE